MQPFCCAGCKAVAETIVGSGLESYYLDREATLDSRAPIPESLAVLTAFDHPSVQKEFVAREGALATAELTLENLSCAACAWLIEKKLGQEPGVVQASVNLSTHRLHLCWDDSTTVSRLLSTLEHIGYRARPYRADAHAAQLAAESNDLLKRLAVAGFGMMQVMMYAGALYGGAIHGMEQEYRDYLRWINLLITTPVFFYSGKPFYRSAWQTLNSRHLNMDVPVSLALISAYAASVYATVSGHGDVYFDSVSMFIFFLLTSHFLETRARQRAGETAARLMALTPNLATRIDRSGQQDIVAAGDLCAGEHILVKPGETVAADGIVLEGRSDVSEALLTGEPLPLAKNPGDSVLSGSINADGSLIIRVTRSASDSTLGTLNRLLNRALADKPRLAHRADELAQVFVAIVLGLAVMVFFAWAHAASYREAFWITLAVLVATCPCALSLATPMALSSATNALAQSGFLISRGHVLETLARATHIIFDKTGTLTEGNLQITASTAWRGDMASAWRIACALEQRSEHPVARAFQARQEPNLPAVQNMVHTPGAGVSADIDGRHYRLGHAAFACGEAGVPRQAARSAHEKLWLADAAGALASFTLSDTLRPEATRTVRALQERGLITCLFSGDHSPAPHTMGAALGMAQVAGGLSPDDKLTRVQQLQKDGAVVVMIGDGVNDAPVLAQAHLSIAMASGSDLAHLTADALLLRDDLGRIVDAIDMAHKTRMVIRQNLGWALAYNLAVLPLAALGYLPPWAAALGMSLSSLLVVGNALRLHTRKT